MVVTVEVPTYPLNKHILTAKVLYRVDGVSVDAGGSWTSDVVDISMFYLKTVTIVCDYGMKVRIEVSDDLTNWDTYYETTVEANKLYSFWFRELYMYLCVTVENPDTSNPHNIVRLRVKGRVM